jgi:hypothetical protein
MLFLLFLVCHVMGSVVNKESQMCVYGLRIYLNYRSGACYPTLYSPGASTFFIRVPLCSCSSSGSYKSGLGWDILRVIRRIGQREESVRGRICSHCHFLIPKCASMFFSRYEKAHACPLKDQSSS